MLLLIANAAKVFSQSNQKEGNIWYFGQNAGIDFNQSSPQALFNSLLNIPNGCATISNKHGNLLFYTDGFSVLDKNHSIMLNGSMLSGNPTATQPSIIIPNPDSAHVFYIFTNGTSFLKDEFGYSIVDTTLNSGYGDVRTKNIRLNKQPSEKLAATMHRNRKKVWVVTRQKSTNNFYAYLVSGAGVDTIPVISYAGKIQYASTPGILKFSPDGKKLVAASTVGNVFEIFDFNAATGVVSNPHTIDSGFNQQYYGAEFSPSGRYLYINCNLQSVKELYQYDTKAGNMSDIIASKTTVATLPTGVQYALQLAPDGKIYTPVFAQSYLGAINFPEKKGTACDFVLNAFSIAPKTALRGLPNFISSYFFDPILGVEIDTPTCGNLTFTMADTGDIDAIVSSTWDFGDGTTDTGKKITKTYAAHGTYIIKNIIDFGGASPDTVIRTLKTLAKPDARIYKTEQNHCFDNNRFVYTDSTKYINGNFFKSNIWKNSDITFSPANTSSISRNYATAGLKKVTLIVTASNNCVDTAQDSIVVHPSAHTSFSTSGQRCFTIHQLKPLHATNVDTPGAITSYRWDFGDGTNSTLPAPTKVYTDTGNYTIRLIAVEKNGCNDTAYGSFRVLPSPKASFTAGDVCYMDSTIIKNTSTIAKGGLTYSWNYGDGNTGAAFETNRLYADTGSYTIKLVVISDSLCADSVQKIIKVKPKPNADFTYSGRCALSPFVFTDNSMRFNIAIINNQWFFGDGNSFTTSGNAQYTYPMAGLYTAKLVTEAANGCKDSVTKQVNSNPLPVVSLSTNKLEQCLKNNLFDFIYSSTISTGTIKSSLWYFDNSSGVTSPSTISRKYTQPGNYTVKIIAESDSGCFDSVQKNITVHPQVKVDVTISDTAQCFNRHEFDIINNSTINGIGTISKYNWLFSDNSTHNNISPSPKKFATEGNYSVRCIMETDKGCLDTFQQNLMVYFSPSPGFEVQNICLGENANFDNTTADPDITIVRWDWDFGDGKSSTQKSPLYKYPATGNYSIRLISTTEKGCKDTIEKYFPNLVRPVPKAYFEDTMTDSYGLLTTYQFTNGSVGGAQYLWDFGDGTIATDFYPTKVYNTVGHYVVTLKVENQWGCADKFERKLFVMPEMAPIIPNAFTPGKGDDLNSVFRVEGVYVAKEFNMDIFNRWGERIYSTQEPMRGWDGTYNQIPANDGMYMYHVRIMDLKNKVHIYYGSFTLLR